MMDSRVAEKKRGEKENKEHKTNDDDEDINSVVDNGDAMVMSPKDAAGGSGVKKTTLDEALRAIETQNGACSLQRIQSTSEPVEMDDSMSSVSDDEGSATPFSSSGDEDGRAKAGHSHERIELPTVSTENSGSYSDGARGTTHVQKRPWKKPLLGYDPQMPAARRPYAYPFKLKSPKRGRSSGSTTASQRKGGAAATKKKPQYEVEELVARRTRNQVVQYNVKWKGYVETTWEPLKNLSNCQYLIDRFEKKEKMAAAMQDDSIQPVRPPSKILRRPPASGGKLKASDATDSSATPFTPTFFTGREEPLQGKADENGGAKKRGRKHKAVESGTPGASVEEFRKRQREADLESEVAYELIMSDLRCGDHSVIIVSVVRGRNGESPRAQLFSKNRNIEVWLPTDLIAKYQPKLLIDHYERYLNLTL